MAGNATPQFCRNGNLGTPQLLSAANTGSMGVGTIGTNMFQLLQSDASNGTFVDYVRLMPVATTAGVGLSATVVRLFVSSLAGTQSATDTHLIAEMVLPAVSAASATVANIQVDVPLQFRLPAGWYLHATTHVAPAANSGWKAIAIAGDY